MKRRLSQSTSNTLGAKNTAKALQRPYTRTFATIMEEGHKPIRLRLRHPDDHLVFLVNLVNSVPPEQRGADVPFYTVADEIRVFRDMLRLLLNPQNRVLLKGLALADFSKLRRCAACSNFFVRSRKDQMCCCKKCSNVYRVRRWREKYQDHYKIQRDGRAQSMEKEKPHALPARQGKDVVVSFSVRRKNRSRKRPKSEQDHSAGSRKAKAPLALERILNQITRRVLPPTFEKASAKWLASQEGRVAPNTVSVAKTSLKHLLEAFGSRLLCDITDGDVAEYQQKRLRDSAQGETVNIELGSVPPDHEGS